MTGTIYFSGFMEIRSGGVAVVVRASIPPYRRRRRVNVPKPRRRGGGAVTRGGRVGATPTGAATSIGICGMMGGAVSREGIANRTVTCVARFLAA